MRFEIVETKQPVIVVAEDDADMRSMLVHVLREDGHLVDPEECGASLLSRLRRRPDPALVVTDLRMPWLDGLEVLERAQQSGRWVPAIVVTGYADDGVRARARALDVPVLQKPVDLAALRREVRALLHDADPWREPEHDGYSEIRPRALRLAY